MTRKAQQSRREQPATPSSGSVTPRGELIHRDNKERPEPQKGGNRRIRGRRKDIQPRTRPRHLLSGAAERKSTGDTCDPKASLSTQQRGQMVAPGKAPRWGPKATASRSTFFPPRLRLSGGKEQESADGWDEPSRSRKNMFMWQRLGGDQRLPGVICESRLRTEFALPNLTEDIFAVRGRY